MNISKNIRDTWLNISKTNISKYYISKKETECK